MQRHFFATAEDLLVVFERVEAKWSLTYTLTGLFSSPASTSVRSGPAIPTLFAQAPAPGAIAGHTYLVTPATETVLVREVPQQAGGTLYAIDQLANPRSVTLTPGGFYPPDAHLSGRVATASDDETSTRLYRAFATAVGKLFRRVNAFYFGPQAEASRLRRIRLTSDVRSPTEYDLAFGPTA
jgi:hypothetical protein